MSEQAKNFFHWKKNLDTKFIAGEDLQSKLNGLEPEMLVVIERFGENKTFDTNVSKDKVVTDLYLKDVKTGKMLYKPAVLNKTNARFFASEFKSDNVYDWLGKPVIIYAQADRRHGYVVRFKAAPDSAKYDNKVELEKLRGSKTVDELRKNWEELTPQGKADVEISKLKDWLKAKFELVALLETKKGKLGVSDMRNYSRILDENEVDSYEKMKKELEAIK